MSWYSVLIIMIKGRAPADRQINTFREPFDSQLTPYTTHGFNENIRHFCHKVQSQACLKIAKVIFLGDTGVGKTSLIKRFCNKSFDQTYKATIGVDFEVEGFDVLGVPFNIQIWDTAGQERFKCLASSYYRGTNVIVVVFDLSKVNSLSNCTHWLDEAMQENIFNPPTYVMLVGNKLDAISSSAYDGVRQIAAPVAQKLNAEYWAISSKNGKNVKKMFLRTAFLAFESVVLKDINRPIKQISSTSIKVENEKQPTEKNRQKHCAC